MESDIYLLSILAQQEYSILKLIQEIYSRVKSRQSTQHGASLITLQQSYISSLLRLSPNTVVKSLDRLCELKVIAQISNDFGQCALYRYSPNGYRSLLSKAKKQPITLTTGRKKLKKESSAEDILDYIVGKSIIKNLT
jgi:DNA-binding PadR family transcriptional regulator